jgi:Carboxypeptidase regulatory-like domain/TonB dependent receptor-like, beta-barrel/TonB-dependent Receptor Plug Domain
MGERPLKLKPILATLVTLILIFCLSIPANAQVAGAMLTGTVMDSSRSGIPKAKVTITNVATGVARSVETDSAGIYVAPNLTAGTYDVTIEAAGFSTEVERGVVLSVGAKQVLDIPLTVGQLAQTINVTAAAPTVELESSAIGEVVNSTTVRELPLNGRSWTDLANLQPGVVGVETQVPFTSGSNRGSRGFGSQISISGGRPQQNNYRLDGISINDYSNGGPGSVLGGNLGVDAIQEFSVLTSNYSTEYGRTSGGVVNAITRSGTNQFHGSVYEFLRNSALDARNFFDQAVIPPFKRNQFGGSAGGPIIKDRTFIFGDYEGIRQAKGITSVSTVPSANARAGILSTGNVIVDSTVQKFLGLYPLPNGALNSSGDTGKFNFAAQQVVNENFFTTRVDHKFSESDSLFGTYLYDNAKYNSPDAFDDSLVGSQTRRQLIVAEETHVFTPNLVNSVRAGISRSAVANFSGISAINPLAGDPSLGAVPGLDAPLVSVGGLTSYIGGLNSPSHHLFYWTSTQAYDDASLIHGKHSLKFGGGVERIDLNYHLFSIPGGQFTFSSLSNFLTNTPKRFITSLPGTQTPRYIRQTIFGVYIQDDWRWRPNVTINLGLRYEMSSIPSEINGKLSNLRSITDSAPATGSPFFQNPTLRNFEPRVGFAWDPFKNGKTSVRGGFGMFDVMPLPIEFLIPDGTSTPFAQQGSSSHIPQGAFVSGALGALSANTLTALHVDPQPKRNYVMQWNLNVQHEIAPGLTALVGYVGSRGVHQPVKPEDANIVLPTLTSAGYLWPSPIGSGTVVNPNFGDIRGAFFEGTSSYNALQAGIQKRMAHGIQVQTSFTWGRSIDTSSSSGVGDTFSNSIASPLWFDMKAERGLSDFNVSKTLVINGTWEVPIKKSLKGPASWVANGWELGVIFKASDGVPFTPTFGTDGDPQGLNSSDPWAFPNRLGGSGCSTLTNPGNPDNYIKTQCFAVPTAPSQAFYNANCDSSVGDPTTLQCFNLRGNAGRNILIGPGEVNLDFSVFKNNRVPRISETFNAQFRAEFFNVLNHANFSVPVTPDNTDIFDSTGAPTGVAGLLTSTTTTAREIQLALKISW